ncbi:MAG: response regulator transcription factor [Candidatus Cyclobacteriaceae bacterium M2_1C_046]
MKILVVEDQVELAANVESYLQKEGFICEIASNYQKAINKISGYSYDLLLLDLMLPDGNGLDILKYVRGQFPDTGVLIISAKNAIEDKVKGLEMGADDYLAKPFHLSELNARLKSIYRRRHLKGENKLHFHEITIDTDTMEVTIGEKQLELTKKEYEMLLYMLVNKNRVLSKQSIAEHLWGDYMDTADSFDFVYQHIKNLRKKILNVGGQDYIQNMYGSGYKFTDKI